MCDETKERARERRGPKNTPRGLRAEMMMQKTGTEEGCREGKEAGERKEGWQEGGERRGRGQRRRRKGGKEGERRCRRNKERRAQEKIVGIAGVKGEEWKAQRRQQWRRTGGEV